VDVADVFTQLLLHDLVVMEGRSWNS
jgi:hypothetical protein